MMTKTMAGGYVWVKYYTGTGFHKGSRAKRANKTSEHVKRHNQRQRAERLQMLIISNFRGGYFLTLTYRPEQTPKTYEQAEQNLKRALKALQRHFKDKTIKYIGVTEKGARTGKYHHHIIVKDKETSEQLRSNWLRLYGNSQQKRLKDDTDLLKAADYIAKADGKEERKEGSAAYHASRNLKQPERLKPVPVFGTWPAEPEPPKEYKQTHEIIKNTAFSGFIEPLGIKYQSFVLRPKEGARTGKESPNNRGIPSAAGQQSDRSRQPRRARRAARPSILSWLPLRGRRSKKYIELELPKAAAKGNKIKV